MSPSCQNRLVGEIATRLRSRRRWRGRDRNEARSSPRRTRPAPGLSSTQLVEDLLDQGNRCPTCVSGARAAARAMAGAPRAWGRLVRASARSASAPAGRGAPPRPARALPARRLRAYAREQAAVPAGWARRSAAGRSPRSTCCRSRHGVPLTRHPLPALLTARSGRGPRVKIRPKAGRAAARSDVDAGGPGRTTATRPPPHLPTGAPVERLT